MSAAINDTAASPASDPTPRWVEESLDRYSNPIGFARRNQPLPAPKVVDEKVLEAPDGQTVKLTTALLIERPFWSKISLVWTFRPADVEGNADQSVIVVHLAFDTWTGSVQISENRELKVDEIQRPIVGGSWRSKTEFGQLEIKIVPFWTGYEYELRFEGKEVYKHFA